MHEQHTEALAAVEIEGTTRSTFLVRSALAVGSAYGALAVGPFVRDALAGSAGGDVDILNFALTLEYLESDFYNRTGKQVGLSGDAKQLAKAFGAHEAAHVDALASTIKKLGGTPVKKPSFKFGVNDQASFLELAQTLEDTGVGAYNGAAPLVSSDAVLAAAGSIVQVEARHAAAIRLLNDTTPAPDAFDKALQKAAVLKAVKPLIAS